jgi:23S rRNA pseudouridine1911/1915/1917 synthase
MLETLETETDSRAFIVADADAGTRLDAYLAAKIEGWSRARLQKLIDDGEVLVNERPAKSSCKLRAGDTVETELPPNLAANNFAPEDIPLNIIHEDADIIVVNKPAGLVTHPAAGVPGGTLANALSFHFQQLAQRGGAARPGIVHRLDKGTSGLLVVAKTEAAHENLSEQFRARAIFKQYSALVHGVVEGRRGEIDQPLGRNPRLRTQIAVTRTGRPALSLWRVRRRYERFTLLDVEIKTGRTHQIRVHLAWLKHPVVGDALYNSGRDKTTADKPARIAIAALGRQFLHAEHLGFTHPRTGEAMRFHAPLPAELDNLLAALDGAPKDGNP